MDLRHAWRIGNKYGNIPKKFGGRLYHSTLEANFAQVLDLMKKAGEIKEITPQPKFNLEVNGKHICNIIPDFLALDKNGQETIYEVKGAEQEVWKLKWRLMQALYPEYKYEIVRKGDF